MSIINETVDKVKKLVMPETAESVAAAREKAALALQGLEVRHVQLQEEMDEVVMDADVYSEKFNEMERNRTERRRLETLLPLLEKKLTALKAKDKEDAVALKLKQAEKLQEVAAELQRGLYMKAAAIVAAIAAVDEYAQEERSRAIDAVKSASGAYPRINSVRGIIGRGAQKPLHQEVALGNPLNDGRPLWNPHRSGGGSHLLSHGGQLDYDIEGLVKRLLAANDPAAELEQLAETFLPAAAFEPPPPPRNGSREISHAGKGMGSICIDQPLHLRKGTAPVTVEADPWGAAAMAAAVGGPRD